MQVDFYQLGGTPAEQVIASLAEKILAQRRTAAGRCRRRSRSWRASIACCGTRDRPSFLPHALAGGTDDARQPILLSTSPDAPNLARNMLIADGEWRDAALTYDRSFYLFDAATLEGARLAWKLLAGREGVERRYWAQDERAAGCSRPERLRRAPPRG